MGNEKRGTNLTSPPPGNRYLFKSPRWSRVTPLPPAVTRSNTTATSCYPFEQATTNGSGVTLDLRELRKQQGGNENQSGKYREAKRELTKQQGGNENQSGKYRESKRELRKQQGGNGNLNGNRDNSRGEMGIKTGNKTTAGGEMKRELKRSRGGNETHQGRNEKICVN